MSLGEPKRTAAEGWSSPSTHQDSPIERFRAEQTFPGLIPDKSNGPWVRYSDYRALVEGLVEALKGLPRFVPSLEEDEEGEIEAATIHPHDKGDVLRRKDVLAVLTKAQASLKGNTDA